MASESAAPAVEARAGEDGVANPVLHHINLKTARLDEMIAWYGLAVGMRANFRYGPVAFLTNDGANHRLAMFTGYADDPERDTHTGMLHSAFEFGSLQDLVARYLTLKESGIQPFICIDHGLTMSFYYRDPDGNQVELQSDNFGDWSASSEWIRTSPEFLLDPLGKAVDPEKIVSALRAGKSVWAIHESAYANEYPPEDPPELMDPYEGYPPPVPNQSND